MRATRAQRLIPGLDRGWRRYEPRLSELILAITITLMLVAGGLSLLSAATM